MEAEGESKTENEAKSNRATTLRTDAARAHNELLSDTLTQRGRGPRTELALDRVFGPFPRDEPGWVEYEIENGAELLNRPMAD